MNVISRSHGQQFPQNQNKNPTKDNLSDRKLFMHESKKQTNSKKTCSDLILTDRTKALF